MDFRAAIGRETRRFAAVLAEVEPRARVPSCPAWDAADLLWHLTEVQWFWATVVRERLESPEGMGELARPSTYADLLVELRRQADALDAALRTTDPATSVYMWAEDRTVGYIARRQAHEALIHRLDAELTADDVTPLDPALAADGVLEMFEHMYGGCPPWGTFTADPEATVHVVPTDVDGVVPVVLGRFTGTDPEDGTPYDEDDLSTTVADRDVAPRLTVRGRAEDLDAWLWHRRSTHDGRVRLDGDVALGERLGRILAQPIT